MQTFLPYPDYAESARVLDDRRLGNQFYNEGIVLLKGKWPNHPASKMWRGHEWHLGIYLLACATELRRRGRMYPKWELVTLQLMLDKPHEVPPWLGREDVHSSHRANLLRKDPKWYGQFGWTEEPAEGYVWPVA